MAATPSTGNSLRVLDRSSSVESAGSDDDSSSEQDDAFDNERHDSRFRRDNEFWTALRAQAKTEEFSPLNREVAIVNRYPKKTTTGSRQHSNKFAISDDSFDNTSATEDSDSVFSVVSDVSFDEKLLERDIPSPNKTSPETRFWEAIAEGRLAQYGGLSRCTGEAYYNLGLSLLHQGDGDGAWNMFATSASIFKEAYGKSHVGVAKSLHHLGLAALKSDKLLLARDALQKAFKLRTEHLGPFHVDTVHSYANLGDVYLQLDDLANALRCYKEVLTARRAIFGKEHVLVAQTARTLAVIYAKSKFKKRAKQIAEFAALCYELIGNMEDEERSMFAELRKLGVKHEQRVSI